MIWVVIVVVLGLLVILAQLLLSFQTRAARLRVAQSPIRKQISAHKQKLIELAATVRATADTGLAELQQEMAKYTRSCAHAANIVAELDPEAFARAEEMELDLEALEQEAAKEKEKEEDHSDDGLLGERHDIIPRTYVGPEQANPVDQLRSIRHHLEEAYELMESLRHDASLVRQTADRLAPVADKGKDSGEEE